MLKFATAAILCSTGLVLFSDRAEARCGCKKSCESSTCCTPAPTCCAPKPSCCTPAPSCGAPVAPASGTPAVPPAPGDAAPPAPTAASGTGNSNVAQNGRQTYRSYSYDPAPYATGPVYSTPMRSRAAWDNIGKADRKMLGYY